MTLDQHMTTGDYEPCELEGHEQLRFFFDGEPFARILVPEGHHSGHCGRFLVEPLGTIREEFYADRSPTAEYKSLKGPYGQVYGWASMLNDRLKRGR
jgi:hypothetical protein